MDYLYYRASLAESQKKAYDAIYACAKNRAKEVRLPFFSLYGQFETIYQAVYLDHPELFYLSREFGIRRGFFSLHFVPHYAFGEEEIRSYERFFAERFAALFAAEKSVEDPLERELFVHDLICHDVVYGNSGSEWAHTFMGPLMERLGVCEGIAKLAKVAFDYLEVPSFLIFGTLKGEPHLWNLVQLEGKSYHLDITNDLASSSHLLSHSYFNVPSVRLKNHLYVSPVTFSADSEAKNFFVTHQLSFPDYASALAFLRHYRGKEKSLQIRLEIEAKADYAPDFAAILSGGIFFGRGPVNYRFEEGLNVYSFSWE